MGKSQYGRWCPDTFDCNDCVHSESHISTSRPILSYDHRSLWGHRCTGRNLLYYGSLYTGESMARYAGEKFLHSSLLLIQSAIMVYTRNAMVSFQFVATHNALKVSILIAIGSLISLVSTAAGCTWYYGFAELNNELWRNWQKRIENLNAETERQNIRPKAE